MKTHFMFGRMDVHIHLMRIYLQIQHKGRLLVGAQFVFTGLANRVINQAIAHHPPIDVAILNLRQRRIGMQRIGHPAAEGKIPMLPLNRQRVFEKWQTADRAQTPLALAVLRYRPVLAHGLAVVAEVDGHVEARQRNAPHDLVDMAKLGFLGAHKFAPGGGVIKQIQHFQRCPNRVRRRLHGDRLIAPFGIGLPGLLLILGTRGQRQASH